MGTRILTWGTQKYPGASYGGIILPAYYVEKACGLSAVRIHAGTAPHSEDATFDIMSDGVSIFNNHAYEPEVMTAGDPTLYPADTSVSLFSGETSEVLADDFNSGEIEAGSWVTCKCNQDGAGKNFTIQLELEEID
jgi:hypothetical protein